MDETVTSHNTKKRAMLQEVLEKRAGFDALYTHSGKFTRIGGWIYKIKDGSKKGPKSLLMLAHLST